MCPQQTGVLDQNSLVNVPDLKHTGFSKTLPRQVSHLVLTRARHRLLFALFVNIGQHGNSFAPDTVPKSFFIHVYKQKNSLL